MLHNFPFFKYSIDAITFFWYMVSSFTQAGFPFVQVKDTLWEGGVRGAALVWSPLLKSSPRVSNQMMNIQDWLPTLYSAAGMAAHPLLCCRYGCPVPTLYSAAGMVAHPLLCCRYGCPPCALLQVWQPILYSAAGMVAHPLLCCRYGCPPFTLLQVWLPTLYSAAGMVAHPLLCCRYGCPPCALLQVWQPILYSAAGMVAHK